MTPGCKEFTVTPVFLSLSANSIVKKRVHNFVRQYSNVFPGYSFRSFEMKRFDGTTLAAIEDTFTIRLLPDFFKIPKKRTMNQSCFVLCGVYPKVNSSIKTAISDSLA